MRAPNSLLHLSLIALISALACGNVTTNTSAGSGSAHDAGPSGDANAPRVKERFVTIELPPVVARSVTQDDNGIFQWGPTENIDNALSCITERRDAYAIFEDYEPLAEKLCVETSAGEAPLISGVPANSDLTITVKKDGYLPAVMIHRVEAQDVLRRLQVAPLRTVLLTALQAELFDSAGSGGGEEAGFLSIEFSMFLRPGLTREAAGRFLTPGHPVFKLAQGVGVHLDAESRAFSKHYAPAETQILQALPADVYRAQLNHPNAFCEALGAPFGLTPWGLSTDTTGELEVRVLPGHVAYLHAVCHCFPPSAAHVLVDEAKCLFDEPAETP